MNSADDNECRTGGVAVIVDPDHPDQGWIEMLVDLDDVRVYPGGTEDEPTQIGIQFDYLSGSVCNLVNVVHTAHDELLELMDAARD